MTAPALADAGPRGDLRPLALLLGLAALAFSPVLFAGFTTFDDPFWITGNPALTPPSALKLKELWTGPFYDLYAPLAHTVWYLASLLAWHDGQGLSPWPFHLASLATHLASVTLLFAFLRRVFPGSPRAAFAGALLFALHPVMVESVAWASGLKDLLCTLGMTISLWSLAALSKPRATLAAPAPVVGVPSVFGPQAEAPLETRRPQARPLSYRLFLIAGLAVALLSKPTGIMLPLMLSATALILFRIRPSKLFVPAVLAILATAPVAILTARWQVPTDAAPLPLSSRLLVAADALGFHIAHAAWPFVTHGIDYGRSPAWVARDLHWAPDATLLVLAAILLLATRSRVALAGAALFLFPLLPVLGLRDFDFASLSVVTDHYAYPAMIGAALIAAWLASLLEKTLDLRFLSTALALVLVPLAFRQSLAWHDDAALNARGLAANPASAYVNASEAARLLPTDPARALGHARRALVAWPAYPTANYNAGLAALALNHPDEALRYFDAAAPKFATRSSAFHASVGDAFAALGDQEHARANYRAALRINPGSAGARQGLRKLGDAK